MSRCICVSEQVSGYRIFNVPHLQSALFISPTVEKLFIYLQMDASQELSYIHNFRECFIFEEGFKENDKDDKRAEYQKILDLRRTLGLPWWRSG